MYENLYSRVKLIIGIKILEGNFEMKIFGIVFWMICFCYIDIVRSQLWILLFDCYQILPLVLI